MIGLSQIAIEQLSNGWVLRMSQGTDPEIRHFEPTFDAVLTDLVQMNENSKKFAAEQGAKNVERNITPFPGESKDVNPNNIQ